MLKDLVPTSWNNILAEIIEDPQFKELSDFVQKHYESDATIYPQRHRIFYALEKVEPMSVKAVLIGQDPYHGQDQAMGLSFSVPLGHKIPPSLRNIFKEYMEDLSLPYPLSGDLTSWAEEGVLLLNSILTVESKKPGSHAKSGWQWLTDSIIKTLSDRRDNLVFLLWGNYAQEKRTLIDSSRHLILEAAHPSPLARNKFSGCRHFSKSNLYLSNNHINPINWKLD